MTLKEAQNKIKALKNLDYAINERVLKEAIDVCREFYNEGYEFLDIWFNGGNVVLEVSRNDGVITKITVDETGSVNFSFKEEGGDYDGNDYRVERVG